MLVSWSAWTNLRCLAGRRPPDRPGTFRGAPFRAHAHDPTGESAPSWIGCPSHEGDSPRVPSNLVDLPVRARRCRLAWRGSEPILADRITRPCGTLPEPCGPGRDPLRVSRANTFRSSLATVSVHPGGWSVVWSIHPSVHLECRDEGSCKPSTRSVHDYWQSRTHVPVGS